MKTVKLIDFGFAVGRLSYDPDQGQEFRAFMPQLTLTTPSVAEEGVYTPAESFSLYGQGSLFALRDALNAAFPPNLTGDRT